MIHMHAASPGGTETGIVADGACTNPWHPKRINCPQCGRSRKIVLASAMIQGEPVYLHCLRCRHLWQPPRLVP
jgi:formate dehydrogenase maturation protein FdhE